MIIKGKSRGNPGSLAKHLGNSETNEFIRIVDVKGSAGSDLEEILSDLTLYADGKDLKRPLYHAAISPELPHRLTPDQRLEAVDTLEDKLGLTDHARVIVLHEKEGREHLHVVWARVDSDTSKTAHDSFNYRKHEEVARDLERRFGHDRIQGAFAEREDNPRPDRTPSRSELRQEERTGIKGKDVKEEVSLFYRISDGSPEVFKTYLNHYGYTLARGDKRDFVIIDHKGGIHSLARRIEGMNAATLRDFMAPLDRETIPDVEQAKQYLKDLEDQYRLQEKYGLTDKEANCLEASYTGGADYVSQSMAALYDHKIRQSKLNNQFALGSKSLEENNDTDKSDKDQEEFDEKKRKDENEEVENTSETKENSNYLKSSSSLGNVELTDEQQTRIERLLAAMEYNSNSNSNGNGRSGGRGGRKRER